MIDIIFIEVSFRASPPGINIPKEAIGTFLLCFTVWETAVTKVASSGKNSCLVPLGVIKNVAIGNPSNPYNP